MFLYESIDILKALHFFHINMMSIRNETMIKAISDLTIHKFLQVEHQSENIVEVNSRKYIHIEKGKCRLQHRKHMNLCKIPASAL